MQKSGVELTEVRRRLLPPPPLWNPFRSVWAQMWMALLIAVTLTTIAAGIVPDSISTLITVINSFLHEVSHCGIAALGASKCGTITLSLVDDSHINTSTVRPINAVLAAGAGLVGPAWIGAAFLAGAITRVGIEVICIPLGIITFFLTYHGIVAEPEASIALYGFAAFLLIASILPAGVGKSVLAFIAVCLIGKGVLDSVNYAWVDFINGDPNRPSDAQRIAEALGANGVNEVAPILIGLMVLGPLIALIFSIAWLQRHST